MTLLEEISTRLEKVENTLLLSKDILTVVEAAGFSGLSKTFLYKLTHQKKIPHYKPRNKMIYFKKSELENWLLRNKIIPSCIEFNTSETN